MKKITFNKSDDKVAIIASSSGCLGAKEKLQLGIKLLETQGFKCKYDKNILSGCKDLKYFASENEQRLHELKSALLDPEVRIIWAFRGGYGASSIVFDLLDVVPKGDKILIGFSDITALHLLFDQQFSMPSIHGAGITSLLGDQAHMLGSIMSVLAGGEVSFELKAIGRNNARYNSDLSIKGIIGGGNLAVICHMIGSKLLPKMDNKIIFLEDINEKGYHVHRYLMQMYNAGLFSKIKALVFGDFGNSDENLEPSIEHFCANYLQVPVFRARGIGHLADNFPITIGGNGVIEGGVLRVESRFEMI
jgi:muramoyltetrapeptide carboxypeptidase